jgi:hypothetical protein
LGEHDHRTVVYHPPSRFSACFPASSQAAVVPYYAVANVMPVEVEAVAR